MAIVFSTVSSKGQVVIPAELRDQMGITSGTKVAIQREDNHLIVRPVTAEYIRRVRGCLQGNDSLVAAREREHRQEK